MDFELTKEQKIIRSSAREFLKKECPVSLMWELKDDSNGYDPVVWRKMANLGWQGIMIPEEHDGMGGSFLDLAIILEAMGEVCCPGPFFSSIVMGGTAILKGGSDTQKEKLLPRLAKGELICAMALTEPGNWYGMENIHTRTASDGNAFILNGSKLFVQNAHISDLILCVARSAGAAANDGMSLVLVDRKSPGVRCSPLETLAFEKHCKVVFKDVRIPQSHVLGQVGSAKEMIEYLLDLGAVGKCAEMVGGINAVFEKTVSHAKKRKQFGKSIGSFQAVQHHCANMEVDVAAARFLTYQAAWKIANGIPAAMDASMAKAWTNEAARRVTALGHQIHGAISFCEENDMHLYYRKAKACEVAFGDGNFHLEKIAGNLIL